MQGSVASVAENDTFPNFGLKTILAPGPDPVTYLRVGIRMVEDKMIDGSAITALLPGEIAVPAPKEPIQLVSALSGLVRIGHPRPHDGPDAPGDSLKR
jgi:hypothetical protein